MNGRVDVYQNLTYPTFNRVPPTSHTSMYSQEAMRGIFETNDVSGIFFSAQNVSALQQGIRYLVFRKSCEKHIIDNQSEDELKVVMRSIYLQYAKNQPFDALLQVRELNAKVLDYCVPKIMQEIEMYNSYKQRISTLPVPLENAQNMSTKGTDILEFKEF